MAKTTQSTQRAKQVAAAQNFTADRDDRRIVDGEVLYAFLDVPLTTDNAALDVIELLELPLGAMPIPELSYAQVTDDATSGALTANFGDAVDPDRYAVGINLASVGRVEFMSGTLPDAFTNRHKVTAETKLVTMTLATFTATIEAGALRVVLAYKCLG